MGLLGEEAGLRRFALETTDIRTTSPLVAQAVTEQGWPLYGLEPERQDLEALFGAVTLETSTDRHPEVAHG